MCTEHGPSLPMDRELCWLPESKVLYTVSSVHQHHCCNCIDNLSPKIVPLIDLPELLLSALGW